MAYIYFSRRSKHSSAFFEFTLFKSHCKACGKLHVHSDFSANVRLIPAEILRTEDTFKSKQLVLLFLKVGSHNLDWKQ